MRKRSDKQDCKKSKKDLKKMNATGLPNFWNNKIEFYLNRLNKMLRKSIFSKSKSNSKESRKMLTKLKLMKSNSGLKCVSRLRRRLFWSKS
jgi:DNA polymerase III sliding clamp (beta) subunit (PCNA family)